jgi:hypothetical protein
MRGVLHVVGIEERRVSCREWVDQPVGERPLGKFEA